MTVTSRVNLNLKRRHVPSSPTKQQAWTTRTPSLKMAAATHNEDRKYFAINAWRTLTATTSLSDDTLFVWPPESFPNLNALRVSDILLLHFHPSALRHFLFELSLRVFPFPP